MNWKNLVIITAMTIFMSIAGIAYAGGGMGGGMGGSFGGGYGMMGGQGQGMMGYGSNFSNPWGAQPRANLNQNQHKETQQLRDEIRSKRQELSDLYRAEKPNKQMIDQKIEELSRLEAKLDQEMSGSY
jgi:Spy/CpxP family protein refolding chaperone